LTFGKEEHGYAEDAARCIERVFGVKATMGSSQSSIDVHLYGSVIAEILEKVLRVGKGAENKEVPYIIFNASKEVKVNFLLAYLRGDRRLKISSRNFEVQASTMSRKLASDLVTLYAQLGIFAGIESRKPNVRPHKVRSTAQEIVGRRPYYVISVRDLPSLRKMEKIVADLLGPSFDPRRLKSNSQKGSTFDSIPAKIILPLKESMLSEVDHGLREKLKLFFQTGVHNYVRQGRRISYRFLRRVFDHLKDTSNDPRLRFVRNLVQNGVVLLPIRHVRPVEPSSKYVYDVEVSNTHNFVAGLGPILLHNTDGDVYGEHIAMVIISGSANAAHLRELTVPSGKWIGVWGSDIVKHKLPSDPLTDIDIRRIYELKRDPRYKGGVWQKELDVFLKIKRKSELEACAKYGLTAITDKYLPEKLDIAKSL
jgi:intein/homing endonuclease